MDDATPHCCTCSPHTSITIRTAPGVDPAELAAKVAADLDREMKRRPPEGRYERLSRRLFG
jgi:hypothetical protein